MPRNIIMRLKGKNKSLTKKQKYSKAKIFRLNKVKEMRRSMAKIHNFGSSKT